MTDQNVELAKVKIKIRALCNRTINNGCTEAEANAALAKIGELLQIYNLNMSEIDIMEENCVELVFQTYSKQRTAGFSTLVSIGSLCSCIVWYNRTKIGIEYRIFGMESDAQMGLFLLGIIEDSVKTETENFKTTSLWINSKTRKSASTSFIYGMCTRLNQRLNGIKKQNDLDENRRQEERNATEANLNIFDAPKQGFKKTSTNLMVIKNTKVKDEFRKKDLRLRTTQTQRRINDATSYGSGKIAGDRVNLNRPVGNSNSGGYFLK